jgi:hypothetical protein
LEVLGLCCIDHPSNLARLAAAGGLDTISSCKWYQQL